MIELKKGYDSARGASICDWCKGTITPAQNKILYGTGSSLVVCLHPACEEEFQEFYRFIPLAKTNLQSQSLPHELRS